MGSVRITLSKDEYLALIKMVTKLHLDSGCKITTMAMSSAIKSIYKKMHNKVIDGIKNKNNIALNPYEAWAVYTVFIEEDRGNYGAYENVLIDKVISNIHQKIN